MSAPPEGATLAEKKLWVIAELLRMRRDDPERLDRVLAKIERMQNEETAEVAP